MTWMTANEREKVKAFIANPNGHVAREAQSADGAQRRRTKPATPRERKADAWCKWFCAQMKAAGSSDPAEFLPDMAAKIEELIATKIAEELAPARQRIAELEQRVKSASVTAWKLDRARYTATPYTANGQAGATLDLRELFQQFLNETGGES